MNENSSSSTIQRSWIVQDHLMLITMPEILTSTELQANDVEIWSIMQTSPSSFVHFLTDLRGLSVYPSLNDYMSLKSFKHPHLGWTITVGAVQQPLLRFFMTTLTSSARVRYRDFETMPQALAFARTIDNALVDMPRES